jgi:hypothetical protein
MKTQLLIAVLALVSAGYLPAQSNAAPPSHPKGETVVSRFSDGRGNVTLPPESMLREIVDFILPELMKDITLPPGEMPNIVMTKEVGNLQLPGPLTLHRVSLLQIVAFAAAAVDCSLEPMFDPAEIVVPGKTPVIIGYRVTRSQTHRPGSGNVSFPATPGASQPVKSPEDTGRLITRVYALGPVQPMGSQEEMKQFQMREEKQLLDLVNDSLEKAEAQSPPPQLSMHPESRALIVKGTAAQQELVEQVTKALKENQAVEARPATSGKP